MTRPDRHARARSDRAAAQLRRDLILARVARTRRAAIIGAGALAAALAGVVSVVAPGRSSAKVKRTSTTTATAPAARTAVTMPPPAGPRQLGLRPPGSAPRAAVQTQTQAAPQTQTQAAPAPAAPAPTAPVSGGS